MVVRTGLEEEGVVARAGGEGARASKQGMVDRQEDPGGAAARARGEGGPRKGRAVDSSAVRTAPRALVWRCFAMDRHESHTREQLWVAIRANRIGQCRGVVAATLTCYKPPSRL